MSKTLVLTGLLGALGMLGTISYAAGSAAGSYAAAPAGFYPILLQFPNSETADVLGAWNGNWLDPKATVAQLKGGETYQTRYLGAKPITLKGSQAIIGEYPCDSQYSVNLKPASSSAKFQLLTSPKLNVQPRPVVSLPNNTTTYQGIVKQELLKLGMKNPKVSVLGLTRADLDGNGSDEIIIEATTFSEMTPPNVGQAGDYSVLMVRSVVAGKPVTQILDKYIAPLKAWDPASTEPMPMANLYRLANVADLNSDGKMELLVYEAYYEGAYVGVKQWTPTKISTISALGSGCGV